MKKTGFVGVEVWNNINLSKLLVILDGPFVCMSIDFKNVYYIEYYYYT